MWEAISKLGGNPLTLLFALIIIILLIIMIKKGTISYKGKGFTIGGNEDERAILRKQIEYTDAYLSQFITHPILKECDPIKVKYITGKVKDVIESAIMYNHIVLNCSYVEVKTELIMATIRKRTDNPLVSTEEFRSLVANNTRTLFEQLITIREVSKND